MDLKAIREHLAAAILALGAEHPLALRVKTVERRLTPGDALWCNDAASAEVELLAITTEIGQLPKDAIPRSAGIAKGAREKPSTGVPMGANAAIKEIAAAIELL